MKKIVILGAGLAGLSTAYHLQNGCCVYEQEKTPGGLARTEHINGFSFDWTGHLLHFRSDYVKKLINNRLLPGVFKSHKRNAWIFSKNTYTQYPFQANTFGLPVNVIKKCILGRVKATLRQKSKKPINLKDWMLENFGQGITKYFMYPYNHKFWTVPPEELISDWTLDFVPQVGIKDVLNGAFSPKMKPFGYNSEFWYPKKGGIQQIADTFVEKVQRVNLRYQIKAIDIKKRIVYFIDKKSAEFTDLVLTLPLIEFKNLIVNELPQNVSDAFSKLKYISIFNMNFGIKRGKISDKHWVYFPEDKFCFFRVGFPMNFSSDVTPQDMSSIYTEISYSPAKPLKKKGIRERIIKDLINAKILTKDDEILAEHINDIKYAYVVYDHNYCQSTKIINEFLKLNNIYCAGRFGRWKYMSMEDVILDGKNISEQINRV
ncbi:MAG: FAD-dependent oxidoreductase [Candidatus Omnitrophota bacterium]